MPTYTNKIKPLLLAIGSSLLLAGCLGGGGGGGSKPNPDTEGGDGNPVQQIAVRIMPEIPASYGTELKVVGGINIVDLSDDGTAEIPADEDDHQLLMLVSSIGTPLLLAYQPAGSSDAELSLASAAEVFVRMSPVFYGVTAKDQEKFSADIRSHELFSLLTAELDRELAIGSPCPMSRDCSAVAAIYADRIARAIDIEPVSSSN